MAASARRINQHYSLHLRFPVPPRLIKAPQGAEAAEAAEERRKKKEEGRKKKEARRNYGVFFSNNFVQVFLVIDFAGFFLVMTLYCCIFRFFPLQPLLLMCRKTEM